MHLNLSTRNDKHNVSIRQKSIIFRTLFND